MRWKALPATRPRTARRSPHRPTCGPTPQSAEGDEQQQRDAAPIETASAAKPSFLAFRAPDVQAALTILGRWRDRLDEPPPVLDLHLAEIQGAYLVDAWLRDAILEGATGDAAQPGDEQDASES